MDNTRSPLLWNIAYDPIMHAVGTGAVFRGPTEVDDLAALTHGPGNASTSSLKRLRFKASAYFAATLRNNNGPRAHARYGCARHPRLQSPINPCFPRNAMATIDYVDVRNWWVTNGLARV